MEIPANSVIASGPVIIENGKVLLNKELKADGESWWLFPGGEVEDFDKSLEAACRREAKEEMSIELEIIKPLRTLMFPRKGSPDSLVILVHYLAKRIGEITPAENIVKWDWFDVNNLPDDCAPNVYEIIDDYKKEIA